MPPPAEPMALFHGLSHLRFWLLAVGGLTLDLWSKHWAFHTLRQEGEISVVPGVLLFKTMFNPGALFGIGKGQTTLFLVASVLALALVLWMFAHAAPRRWWLHIALGGILAGAIGNMYDRVFVKLVPWASATSVKQYVVDHNDGMRATLREFPPTADAPIVRIPSAALERIGEPIGHVRDFIKIEMRLFGRYLWPWVFNVADMLLVGGVSILAIHLLSEGRKKPQEPVAPDPAGG